MIESGKGNLLKADVEALVNTVNTKGVMGKGLALQFKRAFPEAFREYDRACRAGEVEVGRMHVVERLTSPRYIINFPTKKHWRGRSRLAFIEAGLRDLIRVVREREIASIAIPPLGCGLGGLQWEDVGPHIRSAFAELPSVQVVLFEPGHKPKPAEIVDRRKRPRMTSGRAAVIALMHDYVATGYDYRLSLLEVQKLAYFMQVAGEPLRLDFGAHYYGPYADKLWKVLRHIEGHLTRGLGDGENSPETELEVLPGAVDAATQFLEAKPDVQERLGRVRQLIEGFETPFGMELLATVLWVMRSESHADADLDAAIRAVQAWSSRKAQTMQSHQIEVAWRRLREHQWPVAAAS
ncbi:MAG TPA: Appr-1-p processing protein [Myxococcales bacterium]|nr:Appr-1-p processing protein [Myxococcales bacterium]